MKLSLIVAILLIGTTLSAQRKYSEYSDNERIILLEQKVKKNKIDISGFQGNDSILRKPVFTTEKNFYQLKMPLDTAKNFEIELFVKLEFKKGVINIWGATHPDEKNPEYDTEEDIQYQMDIWSDGIYNVLHRLYNILIGVKGLKKIATYNDPEHRLITIRKVNKEVEFFVNKNLLLTILPPLDVNEIGINIKNKGIEIKHLRISYLTK
ncbi:MAG: hypothetical protein ACPG19_10425 [Saprospiraceae bacterium]